jgi:hypothetical protein
MRSKTGGAAAPLARPVAGRGNRFGGGARARAAGNACDRRHARNERLGRAPRAWHALCE